MSTQEQAREAMVRHRQHSEHVRESMLSREEAEIPNKRELDIQQEARELMAEHRQQEEHQKQSMLSRAEAEIGIAADPVKDS